MLSLINLLRSLPLAHQGQQEDSIPTRLGLGFGNRDGSGFRSRLGFGNRDGSGFRSRLGFGLRRSLGVCDQFPPEADDHDDGYYRSLTPNSIRIIVKKISTTEEPEGEQELEPEDTNKTVLLTNAKK